MGASVGGIADVDSFIVNSELDLEIFDRDPLAVVEATLQALGLFESKPVWRRCLHDVVIPLEREINSNTEAV